MNIIKPAWRRGLEFRAQNMQEHEDRKVVPFAQYRREETEEDQLCQRLIELDDAALRNIDERLSIERRLVEIRSAKRG